MDRRIVGSNHPGNLVRLDLRPCGRGQGSALHCADHRLADPLLMQTDNLVHAQRLKHAMGLDLVDDHRVGDAVASHLDDIVDRHGPADLLNCQLLLDVMVVPRLPLVGVLGTAQ